MAISIIGSTPVKVTEDGTERDLFYNYSTGGSGGGSGTTVVANPEGEATDELETLQVDDTVYSVAGAGGGVLVVTATEGDDGDFTLDKTWKQIYDAVIAVITFPNQNGKTIALPSMIYIDNGDYVVDAFMYGKYVATSENGYPTGRLPD